MHESIRFSGSRLRNVSQASPPFSGALLLDDTRLDGRPVVDGDRKQDYCRVIGNGYPNSYAACTLSEGKAFGATLISPSIDWGYPETRQWRDVNGHGKTDFCRIVGSGRDTLACTFSQGRTRPYFGRTVNSKR